MSTGARVKNGEKGSQDGKNKGDLNPSVFLINDFLSEESYPPHGAGWATVFISKFYLISIHHYR